MALGVDNPLWLLAFIPTAFILINFWKGNYIFSRSRKAVIISLRAIFLSIIILAIAGLQILWPIKGISTVFVVDKSFSTQQQEQKMAAFINDALKTKGVDDKGAIVTFGAEAAVERPLSNRDTEITEFQTVIPSGFTNIESGLQLGGSLFSNNERGNIVLLTDGNENIGNAVKQATYLKQQGYIINVLPISPERGNDIAIQSFDAPASTHVGEKAKMALGITSNTANTAAITIYEDQIPILNEQVVLSEGSNQFGFDHLIKNTGFHTYKAEIVSSNDTVLENNQFYAFSETTGVPNILLVEGYEGDSTNIKNVLNSSLVNITSITPELLPTNLGAFIHYDSIIFSNVSATRVTGNQMELINRAVHDFGVGFIMTGGNESYGLGGYFKTPIEELLPVKMDVKGEKELPSLGLVVVMDRSGSMSGGKIELTREAAARSVELLREKDTLGVIAFDSQPWEIVKTGPIKDKKKTINNIRSITSGGGTDIFPALELAYERLSELSLKRKHIILLTDGQSPVSPNYQVMIEEGKAKNITVSTVAVGQDADTAILEEISTLGGGRFYNVTDTTSIPTIFSRETTLMTRTYIEDKPFYPSIVNGYEWSSNFADGVPQVNAYIATSPKERAQQVLISEKKDPLLIRWQYGLGKSVAWTSDAKEWAGEWPVWQKWPTLWNEIIGWTFPQYNRQPYDIQSNVEGNKIVLNVTASDYATTKVESSLISADGKDTDISLHLKAPGEFKGSFTTNNPGVYYLQLTEKEGKETSGTFKTGIVVPYSKEFEFTEKDEKLLQEVAVAGGGKVLSSPNEVFSMKIPTRYEKQNIAIPLLLFAIFVFLLDVAVRRFQISFSFIDRILSRRFSKKSDQQDALKQSKQFQQLKKAATKRKSPVPYHESNPILVKEDKGTIKEKQQDREVTKNNSQENSMTDRKEQLDRLLKARKRR